MLEINLIFRIKLIPQIGLIFRTRGSISLIHVQFFQCRTCVFSYKVSLLFHSSSMLVFVYLEDIRKNIGRDLILRNKYSFIKGLSIFRSGDFIVI